MEVLRIFTRLGLTSFGGSTAHLGYFRDEFVDKRKWLTDEEYADLVALCQFMPGPASSQVGMAIGLKRAGYGGMFAAFVGFTLPSVILLVAFALGVARLGDISGAGWLAGMKAAAVAVVAQAVLGMAKSIVTDRLRAAVALAAFLVVLLVPHPLAQVGAIAVGMLVTLVLLRIDAPSHPIPATPQRSAVGCWRDAVLGSPARQPEGCQCLGWRKRSSCGHLGRRAVQPCVHRRHPRACDDGGCRGGVRGATQLQGSSLGCGSAGGPGWLGCVVSGAVAWAPCTRTTF